MTGGGGGVGIAPIICMNLYTPQLRQLAPYVRFGVDDILSWKILKTKSGDDWCTLSLWPPAVSSLNSVFANKKSVAASLAQPAVFFSVVDSTPLFAVGLSDGPWRLQIAWGASGLTPPVLPCRRWFLPSKHWHWLKVGSMLSRRRRNILLTVSPKCPLYSYYT